MRLTTFVDVATQFRGFWRNFVDLFDLHGRKLYVTGESYAGQYVRTHYDIATRLQ